MSLIYESLKKTGASGESETIEIKQQETDKKAVLKISYLRSPVVLTFLALAGLSAIGIVRFLATDSEEIHYNEIKSVHRVETTLPVARESMPDTPIASSASAPRIENHADLTTVGEISEKNAGPDPAPASMHSPMIDPENVSPTAEKFPSGSPIPIKHDVTQRTVSQTITQTPRSTTHPHEETDVDKESPVGRHESAETTTPLTRVVLRDTENKIQTNKSRPAESVSSLVAKIQTAVQKGNREEVENFIAKLVILKGKDDDFVKKIKAYHHLHEHEYDTAFILLSQVLANNRHDFEAGINMAILEIQTGKVEYARERLEMLSRVHPDNRTIRHLQEMIR